MHLNLDGHNSGLADGKIGALTREAIRTWQLENGYAGDGYANVDFLMILKKKSRKTDLDQ
jgi:peptidoglycan hydrolase-like protein with peptidoglycan-binding domain